MAAEWAGAEEEAEADNGVLLESREDGTPYAPMPPAAPLPLEEESLAAIALLRAISARSRSEALMAVVPGREEEEGGAPAEEEDAELLASESLLEP
mmetsp:Transcript_30205/g.61602  ORF Transcript_30205/g.61602 Transcript_30205/m.61602 type:complete len:96 (-) Transcript_30205:99-386(-)